MNRELEPDYDIFRVYDQSYNSEEGRALLTNGIETFAVSTYGEYAIDRLGSRYKFCIADSCWYRLSE